MKVTSKYALTVALLGTALLMSSQLRAQSLAKNTDWLEKQLNTLVIDGYKSNVNGKKSAPKFDFKECQLTMKLESEDKADPMGMNFTWQLKDIRKIGYKQEKNGQYTLVLDAPADKVGMDVGGISVSMSSNEQGKKSIKNTKDNTNSFTLNTTDEALVQQIKRRFDESVQLCQKTN